MGQPSRRGSSDHYKFCFDWLAWDNEKKIDHRIGGQSHTMTVTRTGKDPRIEIKLRLRMYKDQDTAEEVAALVLSHIKDLEALPSFRLRDVFLEAGIVGIQLLFRPAKITQDAPIKTLFDVCEAIGLPFPPTQISVQHAYEVRVRDKDGNHTTRSRNRGIEVETLYRWN
jgi:hypothetical protein